MSREIKVCVDSSGGETDNLTVGVWCAFFIVGLLSFY